MNLHSPWEKQPIICGPPTQNAGTIPVPTEKIPDIPKTKIQTRQAIADSSIANRFTIVTAAHDKSYLCDYMAASFKKSIGWLPEIIVMNNGREIHRSVFDFDKWTEVDNRGYKLSKEWNHLSGKTSARHCASLSFAMDKLVSTEYVILVDNDILFKPDAANLFSNLYADAVGEIGHRTIRANRLFPFFCIINRMKMKSQKISYFDPYRLNVHGPGKKYETGSSFTEDILKHHWNIKHIRLKNYILHLSSATLEHKPTTEWLKKHRNLHGLPV